MNFLRRRLLAAASAAPLAGASAAAAPVRVAIVFYSRRGENYWPGEGVRNLERGNTEVLAAMLGEALDARGCAVRAFLRLEEAEPYPEGYRRATEFVKDEQARGARRALKPGAPIDWKDIDAVLIGHPVWWGRLPPPVAGWAEANAAALAGKAVFQFSTHEGSGEGATRGEMRRLLPASLHRGGLSVYGHEAAGAAEAVRAWAAANF